MIYVMSKLMYHNCINGTSTQKPMEHTELVAYLNHSLGLRGTITEIQISN